MELEKLPQPTKDALDSRGGVIEPITIWLIKVIMVDFSIKAAVGTAVYATIWSETADNAAAQVTKYASAIVAALNRRLVKIVQKIRGVNPSYAMEIKEILFEKSLSNQEKLELLKIKIEYALKNLKGSKRKQFIWFIIATLAFFAGGNFPLFAWFMERLRTLIGKNEDIYSIHEHLIELYMEYNAPLPRELVEELPP